MTTLIALFRGINVGGRNLLKMKALTALLTDLGLEQVRSYIQSGNVVFESRDTPSNALTTRIRSAILTQHGFEPDLIIMDANRLIRAMADNPFPEADAAPGTVHLTFLSAPPPHPDLDGLEKLRAPSERFALQGDSFFLHAPEGIGRSKLAARIETALGVAGTSRNWRTVTRLRDMLEQ